MSELETVLMENKKYVLLYCASWCDPCKKLKEWIDTEYSNSITICVIDIDNPDVESICSHVNALPTTEIFVSSKCVFSLEGYRKDELQVEFDKLLSFDEDWSKDENFDVINGAGI